MRKTIQILTISITISGILDGGYFLWDQLSRVSKTDLEQVVRRDGISFDVKSIPDEVVDRLASNRVVIVGEFHFLHEHRVLVAELMRELHARGFRQYLFEWTQSADWLIGDYVNHGGLGGNYRKRKVGKVFRRANAKNEEPCRA